jgi:uncharacterized protein YbbC (DUF1343 family)
MQGVGCRIYTFAYTMAIACEPQKFGKKVIVCDRPNPIGGVKVSGTFWLPTLFLSWAVPAANPAWMTHGELALIQ